jgi:hypothetical protein
MRLWMKVLSRLWWRAETPGHFEIFIIGERSLQSGTSAGLRFSLTGKSDTAVVSRSNHLMIEAATN